jgi:hypothetical protein
MVSLGIHTPAAQLYGKLFTSLSGPTVNNATARQLEMWEENKQGKSRTISPI